MGYDFFHLATFAANVAVCLIFLYLLSYSKWQTVASSTQIVSGTSSPVTNYYYSVAREASTRYIALSFFMSFVSLFWFFDNDEDNYNLLRPLLLADVPYKEVFAIGTLVQLAESVLRLAAVWFAWTSNVVGTQALGLQAVVWGLLLMASLFFWVSLFQHRQAVNKYSGKAVADIDTKFSTGVAVTFHILAALFNLAQIILQIIASGEGALQLDGSSANFTVNFYLTVSQSIFTQYLIVAIGGFFLGLRHTIVALTAPAPGEPVVVTEGFLAELRDWAPKDFYIIGPMFVFFIESGLRIIAFVAVTQNISSQGLTQSIISAIWVSQLLATIFQFLSSWAQQDAAFVAAAKAKENKVVAPCNTKLNITLALSIAVAWVLWLQSH